LNYIYHVLEPIYSGLGAINKWRIHLNYRFL